MNEPIAKDIPDEPYSSNGGEPIPLPALTHLQFLVLDIARGNSDGISSHAMQEALRKEGQEQSGPKFYQLMQRLVSAGWIVSWSQSFDIAGSSVTRTFYKLSSEGTVAHSMTIAFYEYRLRLYRQLNDGE
ncbi:MAG: hypothetical protein U0936_24310 [Planctomycetaceae bacterium]